MKLFKWIIVAALIIVPRADAQVAAPSGMALDGATANGIPIQSEVCQIGTTATTCAAGNIPAQVAATAQSNLTAAQGALQAEITANATTAAAAQAAANANASAIATLQAQVTALTARLAPTFNATSGVMEYILPNGLQDFFTPSSTSTSTPTAPGAPTLVATAGTNQVCLAFTYGAANGATVTGINFTRGATSGSETSLISGYTGASPYCDTTAAGGSTYYYKATDTNSAGTSVASNEVSATATSAATAPSAGQLIVYGQAGDNLLQFNEGSANGSPITSNTATRTATVNGSVVTAQISIGVPSNGTFVGYTDSAAPQNVSSCYTVTSTNAIGTSSPSASVCATATSTSTVPAAPTIASISTSITSPGSVSQNVLTFSDNGNGGSAITSNYIFRGTTSGGEFSNVSSNGSPIPLATVSASTTSYTDTSAQGGVKYYYVVEALNSVGLSTASNEVNVTTAAVNSNSALVSLNTVGGGTVSFNWGQKLTATETGGGSSPIVLSSAAQSSPNGLSALVTTMTSGNGCYTAQITNNNPNSPVYNAGIALVGSNGQVSAFTEQTGTLAVQNWTNYSSYSSVYSGSLTAVYNTPVWLRECLNNGTYYFAESPDGQANDWNVVTSQSASTLGNPVSIGPEILPADVNNTGITSSLTLTALNFVANGGIQDIAPGVTAVTPAVPATPSGLVATGAPTSVILSGATATATPPVSGFDIFQGTTSGGESTTAIATNVSLPYTATGLTASTLYYFKVKARNSIGLSASYSNEASATAQAGSSTFTTATTLLGNDVPALAFSLDPATATTTAALSGGTTGIQIDGSNNVLNIVDPVNLYSVTPGAGRVQITQGGPGGFPYFRSLATGTNYDTLVMPASAGSAFEAASGEAWTMGFVLSQTSDGNIELMRLLQANDFSQTNVVINQANSNSAGDGALYIDQNNGAAGATEPSSAKTALNQNQIIFAQTDGTKFCIWRNGGSPTVCTPTGTIGGFTPANFEFLNDVGDNVSLIFGAPGALDNAQLTQLQSDLATRYGITGTTAVTGGPSSYIAPTSLSNTFSNYITAAVLPDTADPTDNTATPYNWPSGDTGNLTNFASFVFGSGSTNLFGQTPNITSEAVMGHHFMYDQTGGYPQSNIGDPNNQNANPSNSWNGRYFTFPIGDVHDTHVINASGLQLKAFCSGNGGTLCQGDANIVTGIVRPMTEFSMIQDWVAETCRKKPGSGSPGAWPTNWFFDGAQPSAPGVPFSQYYQAGNPPYFINSHYNEIDAPDGYAFTDGQPSASSLTAGAPTNGDSAQQYARLYAAQGGIFTDQYVLGNDGVTTSTDLSQAVHCYQVEMVPSTYTDSSYSTVATPGKVIYLLDGVVYKIDQYASISGNVTDSAGNFVQAYGWYSWMVGLQYGTVFDNNNYNAMTPANVAAATDIITSMRAWHRTGGSPPTPTYPNGG